MGTSGVERTLKQLDAHLRRRRRALRLADLKRKIARVRKVIQLGVRGTTAWRSVHAGRKSLWALSLAPAGHRGFCNAYFANHGLESLRKTWRSLHETIEAPRQLTLDWGQEEAEHRPAAGATTCGPDESDGNRTCPVL